MRDSQMFNILSNLDGKKKTNITESINNDTAIKSNPESTMRNLLEKMESTPMSRQLNEGLGSVGPKLKAMAGKHKMAKAGKKKHPANRFLVGGEEGEVPAQQDAQLNEIGEGNLYDGLLQELQEWLADFQQMGENNHGSVQELYYAMSNIVERHAGDNSNMEETSKDPLSDKWNDEIPADSEDEVEDGSIANKWRKGGPKDDARREKDEYLRDNPRHYESIEESEDDCDDECEAEADRDIFGIDDDDFDDEDSDDYAYESAEGRFVNGGSNSYQPVTEDEIDEDAFGEKQSFAEVFKSMEESEEESSARLEKELFTELNEPKPLKKNDETGKYDLSDSEE